MIWFLQTRLGFYLYMDCLWLTLFSLLFQFSCINPLMHGQKKLRNSWSICSLSLKVKMNRGLSAPSYERQFGIYCTNLKYLNSISIFTNDSPFNSLCFLLPMLWQITMNVEGCKNLISFGGLAAVSDCNMELAFIRVALWTLKLYIYCFLPDWSS